MSDLKITIIQARLVWEHRDKNISNFDTLLNRVKRNTTHLIVLPEMFSTGFTMNTKSMAETMEGSSVAWMHNVAETKNAVVCGSLIIKERGKYFNRLVWMQPNGKVHTYDKRHLFRMARENNYYSAGAKKFIGEIKGWRICPQVCYDLRFPVWSRNTQKEKFDVLLYVANWPKRRNFAWRQLLIARAIENQVYVAGVNRIGKDGNGIDYTGDSVVLDPLGKKVSKTKSSRQSVETILLSEKALKELRKNFPVLLDADEFKIKS